jgi:hypothetical protein
MQQQLWAGFGSHQSAMQGSMYAAAEQSWHCACSLLYMSDPWVTVCVAAAVNKLALTFRLPPLSTLLPGQCIQSCRQQQAAAGPAQGWQVCGCLMLHMQLL